MDYRRLFDAKLQRRLRKNTEITTLQEFPARHDHTATGLEGQNNLERQHAIPDGGQAAGAVGAGLRIKCIVSGQHQISRAVPKVPGAISKYQQAARWDWIFLFSMFWGSGASLLRFPFQDRNCLRRHIFQLPSIALANFLKENMEDF